MEKNFTFHNKDLYESLCNIADMVAATHNPCKIKDGKCLRGIFCCSGCEYLGESGCTTKCLFCKLWVCSAAMSLISDKQTFKSNMFGIFNIAKSNGLLMARASYDDLINVDIMARKAEYKMPWGNIVWWLKFPKRK